MAQKPPEFKKSSDPKVGIGKCKPFSCEPIEDATVVETRHPADLRDGFTKKYYMEPETPWWDHVPDEENVWKNPREKEYRQKPDPGICRKKPATADTVKVPRTESGDMTA